MIVTSKGIIAAGSEIRGMNCAICGQALDRSGSFIDARWILSRENQLAADDVNGDLCAECGPASRTAVALGDAGRLPPH
jgi:NMD protein affecting ribosome stability and mRNA decay